MSECRNRMMGRYRSDDSDEDHSRKSRKKKKKRTKSSDDSDTSHNSSNRNKKSKKRHRSRSPDRKRTTESRSSRRSRSRSNSLDKYISKRGRSRSTSLDKYVSRKPRSRSRSPDRRASRRSRSPPPRRARSRTRSPVGRRRSRSHSRSRRSKSPSRNRRRSYSRERGRRSRSYDRTNSLSRSSTEARRDTSHSRGSPNVNVKGLSITDASPGFSNMTPSEQAEERMRLALKAAAAADEKLRVREIPSAVSVAASLAESQAFASSVAAIESNSFVQSVFKTSRAKTKMDEVTDTQASHDDAIFGSLSVSGFTIKPDPDMKPLQLDSESIMHPSLYCDPEEKMNKWIHRLTQLRQRKLEGEVMQ